MRAHGDRNDQSYRRYANGYEPSIDVWLRWMPRLKPLAWFGRLVVGCS